MIQSKFTEGHQTVCLLRATSVQNATTNGLTVSEPWRIGRSMGVCVTGGPFASGVSLRLIVQGQRRDDDSFENIIQPDGAGNVAFDVEGDGGDLDTNGVLAGSLDLTRFDSETYKAIRITATETGNVAAPVGIVGVITDLYDHPSPDGAADELWTNQRYGS